MNEKEFKEQLITTGIKEEQIANLDFSKIEKIFDSSQNIDEICKNIKESFPNFDETGFRQIISEQTKESENTEYLSEDALEEVAGGSVTSWMHRNKDWVIAATALATIGACYMFNKYLEKKSAANMRGEKLNALSENYN